MRFLKRTGKLLIILFAIIGILFSGVFLAMKLGLTNVRGSIAERNLYFHKDNSKSIDSNTQNEIVFSCQIHALAEYAPDTARKIQIAYDRTGNPVLAEKMIETASIRYQGTPLSSNLEACRSASVADERPITQTAYIWADSEEWQVLKSVFTKDQDIIRRAAIDAGISPRILLGGIIGEQFRFFGNSREVFKSYFEPLKILANLTSFSYGIAGLKPETVARIDENLKTPSSVFYLGPSMENIITYPEGSDPAIVRFERITDTKDTYYAYLYVGLFMRQVSAQWRASGYEISTMPGVLSTLYNLGFNRSIPKADARPGGAVINVDDKIYSFGELGEQFYYSGELLQEFPY